MWVKSKCKDTFINLFTERNLPMVIPASLVMKDQCAKLAVTWHCSPLQHQRAQSETLGLRFRRRHLINLLSTTEIYPSLKINFILSLGRGSPERTHDVESPSQNASLSIELPEETQPEWATTVLSKYHKLSLA